MATGNGHIAGAAPMGTASSGGNTVPPQTSPKRSRDDVNISEEEARDEGPLTLAVLQQALQVNQQQITNSLQESLAGIGQRVAQVEANMGEHVKRTTELLNAMTDRHCCMEESVKKVSAGHEELLKRLENLEGRFATATFSTSSTRTTDAGSADHAPRPAVVVGGWDNDQSSEDTLRAVKQHLQDLQCDLDTDDAFVPGLRRGFAIVPIQPRTHEAVGDFRRRVRDALQRVREAKIVTGSRPQGGTDTCGLP